MTLPELNFIGTGLERPECVLAHASGHLIVSDAAGNGGVAVIAPDGRVRKLTCRTRAVHPNGIALAADGTLLLAHLGAGDGGVFALHPDGRIESVIASVGGAALPPTNFVLQDHKQRIWATVSTRKHPRQLDYRPDPSEGFIVLHDARGTRIVADGLGYTNECAVHPDGERLFVNETFGRRVSAFTIRADGSLADRRTVATFGPGTYADGLAFDVDGGMWITSIVSNRVIRVRPDGRQEIVIEDADPAYLESAERDFMAGRLSSAHLDAPGRRTLRNLSSLAFGGADRRTAYLGTLMGDTIPCFRAPVAGLAPAHWERDITALEALFKTI
jgi:sugar lactone lactonase YvrE